MNQIILSIDSKGRKMLKLEAKKHIIKLGENGLSHQKIASMFGIGRSTVTKILLNKESALRLSNEELNDPGMYSTISTLYKLEVKLFLWSTANIPCEMDETDPELEFKLASKVSKVENKFKDELRKSDIMIKAKQLAIESGLRNFNPTNEWFNRFKRKFNIRFRRCLKLSNGNSSNDSINDVDLKGINCNDTNLISNPINYTIKSNIPINFKIEDLYQNDLYLNKPHCHSCLKLLDTLNPNYIESSNLDQNMFNPFELFNEPNLRDPNFYLFDYSNPNMIPSLSMFLDNYNIITNTIHDLQISQKYNWLNNFLSY